MDNIVIGKHTLESLTSGMYADAFVVFREYIQNAADALDEAERRGINPPGQGRIQITLSPSERRISIRDNGTGVPTEHAEKTLLSIGNSRKNPDQARGFRGIGRLAALSYCARLTFETSSPGEAAGTRVTIDARRLSHLLLDETGADTPAAEVLNQVYAVQRYPERAGRHYFHVQMDGVEETSGLNNREEAARYISQNAPVPYDPETFDWGPAIVGRLRREGVAVRSYPIAMTCGQETISLYKPYRNEFLVDRGRQLRDRIQEIEIIPIRDAGGTLAAAGWIAKTNYMGSICDKSVKGIRLRKGNILIGSGQTLNTAFKDARFNGWTIGEIFAVSPDLIPNARRDHFEKNEAYFVLSERLAAIAGGIVREIRSASQARNRAAGETEKKARADGETGAKRAPARPNQAAIQAGSAQTGSREISFESLDMLIGRTRGPTEFKAVNALGGLNNAEKHVLEKVFRILTEEKGDQAAGLIDTILKGFL